MYITCSSDRCVLCMIFSYYNCWLHLAASKKMNAAKQEPDSLEALEGLDTLANLAIQEEGDILTASSQATTRHPRHRPGCTCIVCIQPPSGKGPKHKQTCTCNVCLTVKRRFRTLMLRREMKQSEKEAETARQKVQQPQDEDILDTGNTSPSHKIMINDTSDDDPNMRKSSASPFKGQIDLNIQPEREEELSPVSDSGGIMRLLHQRLSNSGGNRNSVGSSTALDGAVCANFTNGISLDNNSHQGVDTDRPVTSSSTAPDR